MRNGFICGFTLTIVVSSSCRNFRDKNLHGPHPSSTSDTSPLVGRAPTLLSACLLADISPVLCKSSEYTSFLRILSSPELLLTNARFIWGGILMCTAACNSFTGLMIQRFFLGVAEAAVAPGFALLTGMFYTRKEQPLRYDRPDPPSFLVQGPDST